MIFNQNKLIEAKPFKEMLTEKKKGEISSYGLSEAGYDIRIKQKIHFYKDSSGNWWTTISEPDGTITKKRGKFILASTIEQFTMPNYLVGVVHDKSTWARKGLSVLNTVVESSWIGFLTLELVYHGEEELIIPAGSGIAQVLFSQIAVPHSYNGKYQNAGDFAQPAINDKDYKK